MAFVDILAHAESLLLNHSLQADTHPSKTIFGDLVDAAKTNIRIHEEADRNTKIDVDERAQESDEYWSSQQQLAEDPICDDAADSKLSRSDYQRICRTHCLLQDAYRLQQYVRSMWQEYRNGQIELITASTLTEIAILQITRLENEFTHSLPGEEQPAAVNYPDQLNAQTHEAYTANMSVLPEHPEFDLRKYYGLALALVCERRACIQESMLQNRFSAFQEKFTIRYDTDSSTFDSVQQRLLPIYFERCDMQDLGAQLEKDQAFAYVDNCCNKFAFGVFPHWESVVRSRFQIDEDALEQLRSVYSKVLKRCSREDICHYAKEDAVLTELRLAVTCGVCKLSTAFAVAITLDIREILQSSDNCLKSLDQAAETCERVLGTTISGLSPNASSEDQILRLLTHSAKAVRVGDGHDPPWRGTVPRASRQILQSMPMLCARLSLFYQGTTWDSYSGYMDRHPTTRACLQFYNAALQTGHLSTPWPDMEHLIDQQGCDKLFLGARPTTLEQAVNICRMVIDFNVNLGNIYAGRGCVREGVLRGGFKTPEASLCTFTCDRDDRNAPDKFLEDITLLLECYQRNAWSTAKVDGSRILNRDELWKLTAGRQQMSIWRVLELAERRMQEEVRLLQDPFDYALLNRLCDTLVKSTQKILDARGFSRMDLLAGDRNEALHKALSMPLFMYAMAEEQREIAGKKKKKKNASGEVLVKIGCWVNGRSDDAQWLTARGTIVAEIFGLVVREMRSFISEHGGDASRVVAERKAHEMGDQTWVNVGSARMLRVPGGGCPYIHRAIWAWRAGQP